MSRGLAARAATALLGVVTLLGCGGRPPFTAPALPGAQRPPDTAAVFAPEVVSTGAQEFAITFAPDGRSLWFTRRRDSDSVYVLMESDWTGDGWSTPRPAPFSGEHHDADPFMVPGGGRLFFMSRRPLDGSARREDYGIWFVRRRADGWSAPEPAGPGLQTEHSEGFMSLTAGGVLYFVSNRPGGAGGNDLYRAEADGEGFHPPVRLPYPINTPASDSNPLVTPDERCLVFYSGREGGAGRVDLYVAYRRGGRWTDPINLGPRINTPESENAPGLSPDGSAFFFARGGDILWVRTAAIPVLRPCVSAEPTGAP